MRCGQVPVFTLSENLQGKAISSMRTYLVEVHGTLLQTLVNLMNDYSTNLLLYKDGYYQIDSSNHAKLPGQVFTTLHSDLKSSRDNLKSEIELLNTTKDKVSDLVSYSGSSHTSTVMNYNFLMNQLKNLDNSIIQYESNHASQDLVAFKELLSATKALIAEHAGKTRTVGTYQSGDFAKLQSVQRFAMAYQQASKQMESRVERVQAAQERDKVRFEALAAEDRAKNGWKDLAIGVVTVAIGALAIWATMGAATPLVVGAGLTAGIGTAAYGASNAGEGIHNIQLGNAGDAHTKSYNLIRDTLFMGNDKLYHDVGNVFVTASAIMIPIGQTQSVVKGLTQFAIGEAGAYTAGQVAYHGTKLLGGSEEDAQTANFIGNILGGYAVSSAASKFSLNKVKVEVEAPKYNREQILKNLKESKLARESSNFDQYLAKEKLQLGLNKSPLVSRELPRVKGVHDVEAPKYNREQILKNLKESKLARESSNFDQYLAKEKLQLGLNKSPLVSRELPRVKGVHNVETPKYNREQILKNIEESRLARESSKFDNYLRKEYAQQGKYFPERITMPNGKRAYLSADDFEGKQVPVRSRDFVDAQGKIKWPPEGTDGFVLDSAGNAITKPANLKAGQVIDRFGSNGGRFTSPVDNGEILPFNTRGLPYPEGYQVYHQYEIVKDINLENIKSGYKLLSEKDKIVLSKLMKDRHFTLEDMANPQKGQIAKIFGQGGGTQIKFSTSVVWYEKMGILKEVVK
ncbi:glycohydrolase toxin TNT-related protein [Streptococcus mitis]|uniref:glycohydrolase toxin TNT-related protein n=2 Tax=Streptococcus mitis TaxID=28037 RepID=UPI0039C303A8